jgi:hypothetical protein
MVTSSAMAKWFLSGCDQSTEPDVDRGLARARLHLDAVAQQLVDGPIPVVEALAGVSGRLAEQVQGALDQALVVPLLLPEETAQQVLLDVAVALPVAPVPEVGIAQPLPEERHHALLGLLLYLADGAHLRSVLRLAGFDPFGHASAGASTYRHSGGPPACHR